MNFFKVPGSKTSLKLFLVIIFLFITIVGCKSEKDDNSAIWMLALIGNDSSTTEAQINGSVTDSSGNAVSSATITFTDDDGNVMETVTTDSEGKWTLTTGLGTYIATVTDSNGNVIGTFRLTITSYDLEGVTVSEEDAVSVTITSVEAVTVYSIGGSISGLSGSGLVLQNSGGDDLSISSDATSFTFSAKASSYSVTVKTQPTGQTCTVSDGSGTATADVTNVSISCSSGCTTLLAGTMQGCSLNLSTVVSTYAGQAGSTGTTDATGSSARFNQPYRVTTDGTNLYVSDYNNHKVRKIVISTGAVTTLAGSGTIGSTDATGTSASFNYPKGITTDGTNIYLVDANHLVRKIEISTSQVTTFAGTLGTQGSTDATGTSAEFDIPDDITNDGTYLYVADTNACTIRKINISTASVTTIAGTYRGCGTTDGTGTSASFNYPKGITTDGTNLYITDTSSHAIRKMVISTGVVTTIAGTVSASGFTNGTGTSATFNSPMGITTDGTNLYIADWSNYSIRKIVLSSLTVSTLAGSGTSGSSDGTGTSASFSLVGGVVSTGDSLYVTDHGNSTIRKIE